MSDMQTFKAKITKTAKQSRRVTIPEPEWNLEGIDEGDYVEITITKIQKKEAK
jgi:bifunctional DNA-binding transcriptional regulator/antitoxin component of YhaV-PrlF toxin-antitoxin module